jgi:hypothetical protein
MPTWVEKCRLGSRNADLGPEMPTLVEKCRLGSRNAVRGSRNADRGSRNADSGSSNPARGSRNADHGSENSTRHDKSLFRLFPLRFRSYNRSEMPQHVTHSLFTSHPWVICLKNFPAKVRRKFNRRTTGLESEDHTHTHDLPSPTHAV